MVAFTLDFIAGLLKEETYMLAAALPLRSSRQSFRTDAKCERGRVVLAGWETTDVPQRARWFSLELLPGACLMLLEMRNGLRLRPSSLAL